MSTFIPNQKKQFLNISLSGVPKQTTVKDIHLLYCTDETCDNGKVIVDIPEVQVMKNQRLDIPVSSAASGIFLEGLDFTAGGKTVTVRKTSKNKGDNYKLFEKRMTLDVDSDRDLYSVESDLEASKKISGWWVLVLYILLYVMMAVLIVITLGDHKWWGWPYYGVLYLFGKNINEL